MFWSILLCIFNFIFCLSLFATADQKWIENSRQNIFFERQKFYSNAFFVFCFEHSNATKTRNSNRIEISRQNQFSNASFVFCFEHSNATKTRNSNRIEISRQNHFSNASFVYLLSVEYSNTTTTKNSIHFQMENLNHFKRKVKDRGHAPQAFGYIY